MHQLKLVIIKKWLKDHGYKPILYVTMSLGFLGFASMMAIWIFKWDLAHTWFYPVTFWSLFALFFVLLLIGAVRGFWTGVTFGVAFNGEDWSALKKNALNDNNLSYKDIIADIFHSKDLQIQKMNGKFKNNIYKLTVSIEIKNPIEDDTLDRIWEGYVIQVPISKESSEKLVLASKFSGTKNKIVSGDFNHKIQFAEGLKSKNIQFFVAPVSFMTKSLKTENVDFNEKFSIYCKSPENMFYLLQPQDLEDMLTLHEFLSKEAPGFYALFINKEMYWFIPNKIISFENIKRIDTSIAQLKI